MLDLDCCTSETRLIGGGIQALRIKYHREATEKNNTRNPESVG